MSSFVLFLVVLIIQIGRGFSPDNCTTTNGNATHDIGSNETNKSSTSATNQSSKDKGVMINNKDEKARIENDRNSTNKTNDFDNSAFDRMFHELQVIQDVYGIPCLCPIGIIGNGLVTSILLKKDVANSGKRYLIIILMSDILGLVSDLFLPISRLLAQQKSRNIKVAAAKMYFWNSDGLSFLFRRFNLNVFTVLSFERLTAIRKPLELNMSCTVTHFPVFIISCFLFGFVETLSIVSLVTMVPVSDQVTNYTSFAVRSNFSLNRTQLILLFVLRLFDGPFQIIIFTIVNLMIIGQLAKRRKLSAHASSKDRTKQITNQQMKLLKVFMALAVTNILAFFPQSSAILYRTYMRIHSEKQMEPIILLLVSGTHFLRVINSVTDFIMFLVTSKQVREEMSKMLWRRGRHNGNGHSMHQQNVLESSTSNSF